MECVLREATRPMRSSISPAHLAPALARVSRWVMWAALIEFLLYLSEACGMHATCQVYLTEVCQFHCHFAECCCTTAFVKLRQAQFIKPHLHTF